MVTVAEKKHQALVRDIGCIVCLLKMGERTPASVHHAKTGAGGRKNELKVLPLCHFHHQGREGIHTLGRKAWQQKYWSEDELLEKVADIIRCLPY